MWEFPQQRKTNNFSVASPFCCRRPLRPEGIFWTVVGLIYQLCGGSPCQPVSCTFNLVSNGNRQLKRLISFHIPHLCLSLCPSVGLSVSLFRTHAGAHTPLYMCFNIYIVRVFYNHYSLLKVCVVLFRILSNRNDRIYSVYVCACALEKTGISFTA